MTITFADGTRIEVAVTAYNDFVRHDLKWAEFVHGRAATDQLSRNQIRPVVEHVKKIVHPCPSKGC